MSIFYDLAQKSVEVNVQALNTVTVVATVKVKEGNTPSRLAKLGEVEVRLIDIWLGGSLEYLPVEGQPLNEYGKPVTDINGKVTFPNCYAANELLGGWNQYSLEYRHMVTGEYFYDYLYLGESGWHFKGVDYSYA